MSSIQSTKTTSPTKTIGTTTATEPPAPPAVDVGRRRWRWGRRGTAGATIAARLTFEDIVHRYGDVEALRGLSLDVNPGEVMSILGRSGCGKTTLLRVAAGIERQTAGRVLINDREIAGPNRFEPPERRGIGLMFQDYALFPHLSILENVRFGLISLNRASGEHEAMRALERVGMEGLAHDYPHVLSGGQQQRVALARAIVPRPSVLLMDEPFSGLDRGLRERVREETVAVLRETRATCLIVTHDPEEAMQLGDRIALMRDGRLVQVGTAEDLYASPKDLQAARLFSGVNEFEGTVNAGRVATPLGIFAAPGHREGTRVSVAIRAQAIRCGPPDNGIPGRVVAHHFLGEVNHLEVVLSDHEELLKIRLRQGPAPAVGEEVGIDVAPEDVMVFARSG